MFYSDFVLSKKGPLARIWLAAHWDKKLTKAQIFETNIESSIERILKPKVKLALRTSGHLMLGVVRIYSRKTKYLLQDCNEAFVKIKMAFRPGMVDLPEDRGEAAVNAVTLPEVFHDFDSTMVDLNDVDIEVQFSLNQSRADEITMRDDYGNVPVPFPEDGFDVGFDASSSDMLRHSVADFDQSLRQANLIFNQGMDVMDNHKDRPSTSDVSAAMDHMSMDVDLPKDDGFGAGTGGGGLFEGGLFEDTPMPEVPVVDNSSLQVNEPMHSDGAIPSTSKHMLSPMSQRPEGQGPMRLNDDDDFDDDHFIPPSPVGGSSDGSRPPTPVTAGQPPEMGAVSAEPDKDPMSLEEQFNIVNEPAQVMPSTSAEAQLATEAGQDKESTEQNENNQNAEQTTLLQNEEESFALAPVDASALRGLPKTKRKRKLIVDEVKNISGEEMKAQLSDTSDIVITLDLAPPTKRLMHWKETGGVEKLFALPGKSIPSTSLFKNYQRHLTSRAAPNDDLDDHDGNRDANHEPLEMAPPVAPPAPSRRGRKRKQPVVDEEPLQIDTSAAQEISKKSKISPVPNEVIPDLDQSARLPTIAEESLPTNEMAPIPSTPVQMDNGLPPTDLPIPEVPHIEEPMVPAPPAYPETPQPFSDIQAQPLPEFPDMPQQPLDNILQPMSVPPVAPLGQDDITSAPVEQTNMSINNHQDNMMENMGYDEQDQDLQQQMQNTNLFSFNNDDHDNAPITPGMHAGGAVTPWHDTDYDNPASIGPMEERGVDETVEQFEERILNKRAGHLYSTIRMRISSEVPTMFNDLIIGNPKKQVAQKFYSLLVLKKHRVLELTQNEPYDVILLTKGPNFDDPKL